MEVAKDVFLETIDNSPKFRTKFIETQMRDDSALSKEIAELYDLNLINDVYYLGIMKETFNSKKRTQLKSQEIFFIKKTLICQNFLRLIVKFVSKTNEIDNQFANQFHHSFYDEKDQVLVERLLNQVSTEYFANDHNQKTKLN